MTSKTKLLFALVLSLFALTGCSSAHSSDSHSDGNVDYSVYNADAIMFAQMMIPHHDQALVLSDLALKKSANADIMALAKQISLEQGPEIVQMTSWLEASGAGPGDMAAHAGHMDGMLSAEQMAEIEAASGTDFDRLFLEGMRAHHEGAVAMTKSLIENNPNAEVAALARQIIENQTQEIQFINELLKQL